MGEKKKTLKYNQWKYYLIIPQKRVSIINVPVWHFSRSTVHCVPMCTAFLDMVNVPCSFSQYLQTISKYFFFFLGKYMEFKISALYNSSVVNPNPPYSYKKKVQQSHCVFLTSAAFSSWKLLHNGTCFLNSSGFSYLRICLHYNINWD